MRDDFSQQTLDTLAKRVGIRCSNPGCRKLTTGPRSESTKIINIGVGAHITAASSNGPRYKPDLTSDERKSPDNGIWLCQNCAKLVDNDANRYTVELLKEWKRASESAALYELEGMTSVSELGLENQIDLEIKYHKKSMGTYRHDYLLEIKVTNLGSDTIKKYHLDLEFPAPVVEKNNVNKFLVNERCDGTTCFFRAIYPDETDAIYPGDTKSIMTFPYFIDNDLYMNRGGLLEQFVKGTFYRSGFDPLSIEKPFKELQFF